MISDYNNDKYLYSALLVCYIVDSSITLIKNGIFDLRISSISEASASIQQLFTTHILLSVMRKNVCFRITIKSEEMFPRYYVDSDVSKFKYSITR